MAWFARSLLLVGMAASTLTACSTGGTKAELPSAGYVARKEQPGEEYVIGPLDTLNIFVWRNPDLSTKVQVRPDGRITTPLVNDMPAVGKTPAMLQEDLKKALSEYVSNPIVSVIVENFSGTYSQQVRIVGATEKPAAIPYRANMTLLDAMIAVGGLNQYAAGNKAKLVRTDRATGKQQEFALQINDLLRKGDSSANVRLEPGDVIIIPESMF
ncbi:XrtA/PEP-CTERM system exopolysaccharide export protein [Sphingomonas sp. SORGH_AS_0879]|uniref:XrtA/PEP-CTERM system exopolysaccharide export protein n=1 Tax=Sphingomonas sp. SORGH_AS_0879 TaxID=3041790 RepID=UPI002788F802|nr:XrtA/PEP-CTERM system exopolysaccharide export protein [Sphingomonas sp. SORGH_AS_0879]MDQ1230190.1 polysaccharide export outer membrane protein [Sphingomonas sp. SORGH_AS_0879]